MLGNENKLFDSIEDNWSQLLCRTFIVKNTLSNFLFFFYIVNNATKSCQLNYQIKYVKLQVFRKVHHCKGEERVFQ